MKSVKSYFPLTHLSMGPNNNKIFEFELKYCYHIDDNCHIGVFQCRSRGLGSDKTADFGIKFGINTILVRVSRIKG